jgi:MFS family permease
VALLARLYSWLQLALTHEPRPATVATPAAEPELPPRRSDFIRLATFVALMNFSVALASPFFTLYMLRDLAFSYLELTAVGALYVLMQFFALRGWGRLADAYGNRLILHITSLVFPLLPVLWVLLPTFWLVLAIQMLAGTCWAGFSLAANNSLYDVAPVGKRAGYSAWFQTVSHGAIFVGALLGGVIATHAPTAVAIAGTTFEFASGLWATMLVSSAARALTAATLLPTLRELRSVRTLTPGALAVRAIRVNVLADWLLELLPSRRRPPVR